MIYLTCNSNVLFLSFWVFHRPTQSIIYVPLQVNRFPKLILLIIQYNISNPVSETLFSRNWSSAQDYAVLGLLLNPVEFLISAWQKSVRRTWFVLAVYQVWKGISAVLVLKHFTWFIGAGRLPSPRSGRIYRFYRLTVPVPQSWHFRYRFVSLFFFSGLESTS